MRGVGSETQGGQGNYEPFVEKAVGEDERQSETNDGGGVKSRRVDGGRKE